MIYYFPQTSGCAAAESAYLCVVNWQELIALSIVAVAAGSLAWSKFRPRKFSLQRDTHCGCSSPGQSAPRSSILISGRRGQPPQVTMKMK